MACATGVRWLYKLGANFTWDSGYAVPDDLVFFDEQGKVRLIIEADGLVTVTRGYAWNGCSPKVCVLDLLIGTPEGVVHREMQVPKTYYASLVHDALYQFLPDGLPLERRHADRFFRQLLDEADFAPAWIYWLAVRIFGGLVRRATKAKRNWRGSVQRIAERPPDAAPGL